MQMSNMHLRKEETRDEHTENNQTMWIENDISGLKARVPAEDSLHRNKPLIKTTTEEIAYR